MAENVELIQQAFRLLLPVFNKYVTGEIIGVYGKNWWQEVLATLDDQKEHLPVEGEDKDLIASLDIANCIRLLERKWNDLFRKKLARDYRTWANELLGTRHKLAHIGEEDFSQDDTWRALDTVARFCSAFDEETAEKVREMLRKLRYGSSNGSTQVVTISQVPSESKNASVSGIISKPIGTLPSWRTIIEPHPDVAQGRYKNAEFAADLSQVAREEGAIEYRDPVEFFARTFITEGMKGLLQQALKRVIGQDGEPVIQLKTAFGGGKTHSMLALYHLLKAKVSIEKIASVKPVLDSVGLTELPKVNVAVVVGTALDPTKFRRPATMPGIAINTLWGEIAAQLAESAGNSKLYEIVKEADKKGVSPGSKAFKELFDSCGPCLILMDELVAYAKKLYGVPGLPAGSFDNFITFIQEITEAARASKNSLVVAAIPESDIEIGGEAGQKALEAIEHTFGRMESIWKPVAANEGFEVVRRRLFLNCKAPDKRDEVCTRFSRFYSQNASDFPLEAKEVEYRDRMISCYPIHPEIFERLYNDWSTLERFQRTRGVLRLMAAVIHELWMGNDSSALIMPGSIPLNIQNVSYELTRHLGDDNWNAIIDSEVDGKNSVPYRKEQEVTRYGQKLAARRVARTIFLGSAPTSRSQAVRGIEASRVRLGVVQPGENIADFNDAMSALQTSLAYLYTNQSSDRFWYDTRPTLRKTAEDRASQILNSDVEIEIERRLKTLKREQTFAGLHVCPNSSLDVPDEQAVRLVILRPQDTFKQDDIDCAALKCVKDIFNNRGTSPRIYRNMLAFIAPSQESMIALKDGVKHYLAWKSINDESTDLNLDQTQIREVGNNLKRCQETVESRIKETYSWLLVPYIDRVVDMKEIIWESSKLSGGTDGIVLKAAKKMLQSESLITEWAPALLLMEMDNLLWKDTNNIQIKKLWEYLCSYCYLPRLANFYVLEDAIRKGVDSKEYFGLAAGISEGRFVDLKYNEYVSKIDLSSFLVKLADAQKQIEEQRKTSASTKQDNGNNGDTGSGGGNGDSSSTGGSGSTTGTNTGGGSSNGSSSSSSSLTHKHFWMSAPLDNTRINRDVQKLVEEIISHLVTVDGCTVSMHIELVADTADGFPQKTERTVSENCTTLNIKNFGFEE